MSIKIDGPLTDALTLRLAEGINRLVFFFGLGISDFDWVRKPSFPLPEPIQDKMFAICGDHGLAGFLHGEISRKLDQDQTYAAGETDKLRDVESFKDAIVVSRELVETLKSLPFRYRMSAPLPKAFSKEFYSLCEDYELGAGVSIMSGAVLGKDFPISTGIARRDTMLLSQDASAAELMVIPEQLYLVQKSSGYIGRDKASPVMTDFGSTLRQFLGIALAVGVLVEGWHFETPTGSYVAHRTDTDTEIVGSEKMAEPLMRLYGSLRGAEPASSDDDIMAAQRKLKLIKAAFALNDHGRRLSVSAMWYLRSVISQETLDAVLEATISLEALFGGGSTDGGRVSAILANRCAYRIAQTVDARDVILKQFAEIYNLRSRIVHEGHHRFTAKERSLLKEARDICKLSLRREAVLAA